MHHFIVIGNPISHSKSPAIHTAFARSVGLDISYNRQFCPDDFGSFKAVIEAFFHGGGVGANVTLPFKEMAFDICQEVGTLSEYAKNAGAANTLAIKDGKLYGDNTDGRGLVADLVGRGVDLNGKKVAILGAGGATRGAILPLIQSSAVVSVFNRTLTKAQILAQDFAKQGIIINAHGLDELTGHFDVIINATSATTTGQSLDLGGVSADVAYDMMYGKPSAFLEHFNTAKQIDGMGMLINQARLSFELWTGRAVDLDKVVLDL
ncbi:Shikimate dehydrogenase [Moraxella caprae]|uniref:Shikimate dehydrogenase (NADP(+)) n=1 Tax=Moraxella caprae TaxID=90240 RepID=A0A378QWA7_9GAMM|nr:shikimate dehydrogenase [Moraxella caprae]STZ07282.1 Shikimate dehydrogenase [Moraxella caprae]